MHVVTNISSIDEETIELMWDIQELLLAKCPYVHIFHIDIYMIISEKLNNITVINDDVY